jgi:HK97 family phage portal protein
MVERGGLLSRLRLWTRSLFTLTNQDFRPVPRARYRPTEGITDALMSLFGYGRTASDIIVTEETAQNCSAFFRGVSILAHTMASLPIEVVQYRQRIAYPEYDHPIERLYNLDFNVSESAYLGKERLFVDALTKGDGFGVFRYTKDKTKKIGIRVIDPSRVKTQWAEVGGEWVRVHQLDDSDTYLADDEVFHIPGLGYDGLRGKSIISLAREAIAHALALEKYGASNFSGGTIPRGVLKTTQKLDPEARRVRKESWKEVYTHPNDIAILDEDYEFTPIQINNEDRQFLQSRKFQVVEIARWLGVPPYMLGETDSIKYNSAEMLGNDLKTFTLSPWIQRLQNETRRKGLTEDERDRGLVTRVCLDRFLEADVERLYNAERVAIQAGFKSRDEARARLGLPPIPGGEGSRFLVMTNMADGAQSADTSTTDDPDPQPRDTERSE